MLFHTLLFPLIVLVGCISAAPSEATKAARAFGAEPGDVFTNARFSYITLGAGALGSCGKIYQNSDLVRASAGSPRNTHYNDLQGRRTVPSTPPSQRTRARDLLRKHYGLGLGPPSSSGNPADPLNMGGWGMPFFDVKTRS